MRWHYRKPRLLWIIPLSRHVNFRNSGERPAVSEIAVQGSVYVFKAMESQELIVGERVDFDPHRPAGEKGSYVTREEIGVGA